MSCCGKIRRFILTLTSVFTILLVSYISWVYLTLFLKTINIERPGIGNFFGPLFSIFPALIFWALFVLIFKDNGFVTSDTINKICKNNGIDQRRYQTKEIQNILTAKYL